MVQLDCPLQSAVCASYVQHFRGFHSGPVFLIHVRINDVSPQVCNHPWDTQLELIAMSNIKWLSTIYQRLTNTRAHCHILHLTKWKQEHYPPLLQCSLVCHHENENTVHHVLSLKPMTGVHCNGLHFPKVTWEDCHFSLDTWLEFTARVSIFPRWPENTDCHLPQFRPWLEFTVITSTCTW